MSSATYLVIGGGISGLAAAWELSARVPGEQIVLLEATGTTGGKIRGATVAGVRVDVGAESVLARRPEAVQLIREVGLQGDVVHPEARTPLISSRGALHPLPAGTLMGVPGDVSALAGLLTPAEVRRAEQEQLEGPGDASDPSVFEVVAARLGPAVVQRLVEPLLGGVYAGHADQTSTLAALPALMRPYRDGTSLTAMVRQTLADSAAAAARAAAGSGGEDAPAPVFAGIRGGLHRLPEVLTAELRARGVRIETGAVARELVADGASWVVTTGSRATAAPTRYRAERVVVALPAAPAARLLADACPPAAQELSAVPTASVAVVTFAMPAAALGELSGSGVLVPPVEGRTVKAATFSANKWDWVARAGRGAGPEGEDLVLLRASVGRFGEERSLHLDDEELAALCRADLAAILDTALPEPRAWQVQRWGGGLPQYLPGHTARVARIQQALSTVPGLEVAGASYGGVGIPACVASGRAAASRLVAD